MSSHCVALAGLSQGPESLSSVFWIFLWALVQDGRYFCVDCQICTLNLICLFPPSAKALDCREMEKWKKKKKKKECVRESGRKEEHSAMCPRWMASAGLIDQCHCAQQGYWLTIESAAGSGVGVVGKWKAKWAWLPTLPLPQHSSLSTWHCAWWCFVELRLAALHLFIHLFIHQTIQEGLQCVLNTPD